MSKEAGISALRELNSEYPETPSRNKLEIPNRCDINFKSRFCESIQIPGKLSIIWRIVKKNTIKNPFSFKLLPKYRLTTLKIEKIKNTFTTYRI